MNILDKIDKTRIPKHVAIIMDGNGRWAQQHGNERIFGHQNGVTAVRKSVEIAGELGVECLTLYAFSTENWSRPQKEVNALMGLLVQSINNEIDSLLKNGVQLHVIGDTGSLSDDVRQNLFEAIEKTSKGTGLKLVLALSYSGRWDLTQALKTIALKVKEGSIDINDIDDCIITENLSTGKFPELELLIRTSGECRVSNFLLWEVAYAEMYFTEVLWPDFDKEEFVRAIVDFQGRERRFGKTSEQIKL